MGYNVQNVNVRIGRARRMRTHMVILHVKFKTFSEIAHFFTNTIIRAKKCSLVHYYQTHGIHGIKAQSGLM